MQILSLFQASYGSNPRPTRMADLATKFGSVVVCALDTTTPLKKDMSFIPLGTRNKTPIKQALRSCMLMLRNYKYEYWPEFIQTAFIKLQQHKFDYIFCHNLQLLPLACALKEANTNTKIVIDLREYYPKEFEDSLTWRLLVAPYNDYLCRKFLSKADIFLTVSPGLAKAYKKEYDISCELIPSLSYYHKDIKPHATNFPIRCIHHGISTPRRKLETMVEAFIPLKEKYTLDLMLVAANNKYYETLKQLTQEHSHINIIQPVPMPQIVSFIAQYDLGVFLLPSNSFNHQHFLPNKLFEFIQARLGIVVSPVPDMANLVLENNIGRITKDFSSQNLTLALAELSIEKIDEYKTASHKVAQKLAWEENEKKLIQIIFS